MGIAAGLTLPLLSGMLSREGEKSTARIIQGVLRRTQAEALLSGRDWRVNLDWAKGQCQAEQIDSNLPEPAKATGTATPSNVVSHAPAIKSGHGEAVTAKLPAPSRPLLAITDSGTVERPTVTSIVLRPQGLCQPAFIRLEETAGKSAALAISAVGCAVDLLQTDLDTAQKQFEKTHGQPGTPWGNATRATDKS